jgi:hypothetical protein
MAGKLRRQTGTVANSLKIFRPNQHEKSADEVKKISRFLTELEIK